MPQYTQKMKNEAYRAYREVGTLEGAKRLLPFSVSYPTLQRWKERYDWEKKIETDKEALAEREPDKSELSRLTQELDIKGTDQDTFKQIKRIESICYAAIKGNEERLKTINLYPTNFDSAIRALKTCWDTKDKILSRITRPEKEQENKPTRINYVQMVMNQNKGVNADIEETRGLLVSGSQEDSK